MNIPPTTYSNAAQVLFSPWDFVIDFAHLAVIQNVTQAEGGEQQVETTAVAQATQRIVMSPQHAKAFLRILDQNVANYEAQYGDVPDITLT
jgi:hypothetical protein